MDMKHNQTDKVEKHRRYKHSQSSNEKNSLDFKKRKVKKCKKSSVKDISNTKQKKAKHEKEKRKEQKKKKHHKEIKKAEVDVNGFDVPISLMNPNREMAPLTKEEWEKNQNIIKRVFDETSGRYRLIKGSGEVIEEIVNKERHKAINQQATRGDGAYFQKHSSTNLKQ